MELVRDAHDTQGEVQSMFALSAQWQTQLGRIAAAEGQVADAATYFLNQGLFLRHQKDWSHAEKALRRATWTQPASPQLARTRRIGNELYCNLDNPILFCAALVSWRRKDCLQISTEWITRRGGMCHALKNTRSRRAQLVLIGAQDMSPLNDFLSINKDGIYVLSGAAGNERANRV